MDYLEFLRHVHEILQPKRYLEIGVRWGHSLGVARCPTIAIDPAFSINQELAAEIHLFRTTSDEYFARRDPLAPVGGQSFDLSFIDGLHLFEFALRDFIYAERHSRPQGLVGVCPSLRIVTLDGRFAPRKGRSLWESTEHSLRSTAKRR